MPRCVGAVDGAVANLLSGGDAMLAERLFAAVWGGESDLVVPALTVWTVRAGLEARDVPPGVARDESCCGAAEFSSAAGDCLVVDSVPDDVAPAVVPPVVPEFGVFEAVDDPSW